MKHEPFLCDACDKDMRDPKTGMALVGFALTVEMPARMDEFGRKQFGSFEKRSYCFCFECFLNAMMTRAEKDA